ncbi:hypothetical protein D0N36_14430 [Hymenobacter lapidiphilus]|uniref:hypothetical protein n=1 Tax=Hymenobacter sp. CCM 8763 TaxID=2303334 RepID=UPI000E347CB5|nr:hypothetical protein [Hymenobacter sp. CCM 8763]RFP64382.1 hypothetical protein D0N36_14430 [Hymenobacter sp. CCM 8763]
MSEAGANTVAEWLKSLPQEVALADVSEVDTLDERIAAAGVLHANTIGVAEGCIQFCPDNEPPLLDEQLMWLWTFQPQLGIHILAFPISEDCKFLLNAFLKNEMHSFWDYWTQPG